MKVDILTLLQAHQVPMDIVREKTQHVVLMIGGLSRLLDVLRGAGDGDCTRAPRRLSTTVD
eukprot:2651210-Pyramimonas_sp.AAC.1